MAKQHSSETTSIGEIVTILQKENLITEDQIRYAARIRSKMESNRSLLGILKGLNYVDDRQIRNAIRANRITLRFGRLLTELEYINEDDLDQAFRVQKEEGGKRKIGEILVSRRYISEQRMVEVLSLQMGFPYLEAAFEDIDKELFGQAPIRWYEKYRFIPIRRDGKKVVIAFTDPLDKIARNAAKEIFGDHVLPVISLKKSILTAIKKSDERKSDHHLDPSDEHSVVGIVNRIITDAARQNVSDIHIEPLKDRLQIRFRRDGVLEHFKNFPADIITSFTNRIKVMCGADIVEKRRHQGGRFYFDHYGMELDLRVSFYVTIHGEKIVLRILNRRGFLIPLEDLGISPRILTRFIQEALELPSGVILVTGPTGSGKTTTVYSCIDHINDPRTSIISAEEPVEYVIDGISQCTINPKIDLTYKETLRHIVRQDPDVIFIGEIRDQFSADVAIQAALTGHKVLTTFHTEDSIGGLIRLLNMDIEAFLISSTVVGVLAQRLLRRICPHCAEPESPSTGMLQRLGYRPDDLGRAQFMRGKGCSVCRQTGYLGRVAIFELLIPDELIRNAILGQRTSHDIRRISIESSGLVTLLEDGVNKAAAGKTTIEEVLRCLPRLHKPRPIPLIRRFMGGN